MPNATKYSDGGVKPATGRSGSANIEARALIAMDGTTQIEASTGSLENGTAVGNIDKLQLKVLTGDNRPQNFNRLRGGGYWTTTLNGMSRGTELQLQMNVSGVDPRTDVVTVRTTAVRRPDLAVLAVNVPAEARPHDLVTIVAVVGERNGDVGARTNCALSINRAATDVAEQIWVDAGGTVTCLFQHRFDLPGQYSIVVSATSVNPWDWDDANNSAATTIVVREAGAPITKRELDADSYDTHQHHTESNDGAYPMYREWTQDQSYSVALMHGWEVGADAELLRVDAQLTRNGTVELSSTLTPNLASDYDDGSYYQHCRWYDSGVTTGDRYVSDGSFMQMCTAGFHADTRTQTRNYWYQRIDGSVTYFGHETYCDSYGCNTYQWNSASAYGTGARAPWQAGDRIGVNLKFTTSDKVEHTAEIATVLRARNIGYPYHLHDCYADSYRGGTTCTDEVGTGNALVGHLSITLPP